MTDREKLTALFEEASAKCARTKCPECEYDSDECWDKFLIDYLLANGVTFQQWIPVSERLPDTFGTFIVAVRIPTMKRTYSDSADFDPFAKKMDTIFVLGKRHECNTLDSATDTAKGGIKNV